MDVKSKYFCPLCDGDGVISVVRKIDDYNVELRDVRCKLCNGEGILELNDKQKEYVEEMYGKLYKIC